MQRIKRGDTVLVIAGNDRGKKGQVHDVFPKTGKVIVSGINLIKKHQRRTSASTRAQVGIIEREGPLDISNVLLVCKNCGEAVRTRFHYFENGKKGRVCKNCGQPVD